jgi:hypothetical protein
MSFGLNSRTGALHGPDSEDDVDTPKPHQGVPEVYQEYPQAYIVPYR